MGETYLLYADDSGDDADSFMTGLLLPVSAWPVALGQWLRYRQWLHSKHGVPARYELHAYNWIPVKGTPPIPDDPRAAINTSSGLRRETSQKALMTIAGLPGLAVLTARTPGPQKIQAYQALIALADSALAERGAHALVVVDGDPSNPDPNIVAAHRDLDRKTRRVIEDGWVQPAHASQLLQMADLVAYCAFQAHRRRPEREFMWGWYQQYVHASEWSCNCPS